MNDRIKDDADVGGFQRVAATVDPQLLVIGEAAYENGEGLFVRGFRCGVSFDLQSVLVFDLGANA